MITRPLRVRLSFGAAALAASLALLTVGCSDGGKDTNATTPVGTDDGTSVSTGSTVPVSLPADPGAALQQALATLAPGYHFVATVSVNGAASLSAEGDRVGTDSRLAITSSGATVQYVITSTASYAKPSDGDWEQLDSPPATSDPIDALRSPVSVDALAADTTGLHLKVTVTAVSLGIQADGNVAVTVMLLNGTISSMSYDATVQGGTANVTTIITPLNDPTPVTVPTV